jgi:hypothetical protein
MKERDALKSLLARAERSTVGSAPDASGAEAGINGRSKINNCAINGLILISN